ncbi:MAG: hypothetical protein JWQ84_1505 [Mucilaginibacter sp.]|nr:hypothetical protein [Mucilaginibacter sp.]
MREPQYFEQGIEQLHNNKYIEDSIGGFNSYTYDGNKLLKDPRSPAIFQVEIDGLSTSLFLTCTMSKSANNWNLIRIHQDSVMKKH